MIVQCLTLAPVIALKAEIASDEDKQWLSGVLFHLQRSSSGSREKDILTLSSAVQQYVTTQ